MKTRNGFVSNSSSSSFIIAFDNLPGNTQEMHELLFNSSKEKMFQLYDFCDVVSSFEITSLIFRDIASSSEKHFSMQELIYELLCGTADGVPNYYNSKFAKMCDNASSQLHKEALMKNVKVYDDPEFIRKQRDISNTFNEIHGNISMEAAINVATMFLNANKGKLVFSLSYADNEGSIGGQIEHGDTFRNITHIRISHH